MDTLTPLALPPRARGTHHFPQQDASLFSPPRHVIALIETSSFNKHAFTPQGLIQEHPNKARTGGDVMHGPRVWAKDGQARETQTWKMTGETKTMRPASYEEGIGAQKKRTNQWFSCS
jgi:hypothetical protein